MANFTRRQLKEDRFVEEVGRRWHWLDDHRKTIIVASVAVIAAIVGVSSYLGYRHRADSQARAVLQEAVRLFHGAVTLEQRVGVITFATEGERIRRTTEAMEKITQEHGGPAAAAAEYYLALLDIEQDKLAEARARLESVAGRGGPAYDSLIRLTLADVLGRLGESEAAGVQYEELIRSPSLIVPAERAKLAYARHLKDADPAKAKQLLEELLQIPGPVAASAGAVMRELPAGT